MAKLDRDGMLWKAEGVESELFMLAHGDAGDVGCIVANPPKPGDSV